MKIENIQKELKIMNCTKTRFKESKLILVAFLFMGMYINSQIDAQHINDSPYTVIKSHSYYLQEDSFSPTKAALAIPSSVKKRKDVALKLKKVLDGKGINVNLLHIPNNPNYVDSLSNREVFYLYPLERRIYVEKDKGKWYYSKETIAELDEMYSEIYILEINAKKYFPASYWYKKIFGITFIKWLGLLLLIPLCFIVYIASKSIYYLLVNMQLNKKFSISETVREEIKKSAKLFGFFIAAKVFNKLLPELQLPVSWNTFLLRTIGVVAIILFIALINKTIDVITTYFKGKITTDKDYQMLPIINRVLRMLVWTIGFIYMLQYLGVNVITLLTGLSIGGLIIALAAQDTVKNLIGSVMIFIDNPFKLGDWIEFNNIEGKVEQIGIRSTRIRTFEDSVVYVPNSVLADNMVNNLGLRKYRCLKIDLKLEQQIPLPKMNTFIEQLKNVIENHPKTLKDKYSVSLTDVDNGLFNILFYCFFDVNTHEADLRSRHEILLEILTLSEKEKITLALPTNLVYVKEINGNTTI